MFDFKKISSNPWVFTLLAVITVLSAIYAVYANETNKQYASLRYKIASKVTYDPVSIDGLQDVILDQKYRPYGSISVSQVTVWNSGTVPFEPKDLRSPVELIGDQNVTILGYKIINQKSSVENNFSIRQNGNGRLGLDWSIIDPGDAVKIAVLHSGSFESLSLAGKAGPGRSISKVNKWVYFPFIFMIITCILVFAFWASIGARIIAFGERKGGIFEFVTFGLSLILGAMLGIGVLFVLAWSVLYYSGEVSPINADFENSTVAAASK